LRSLKEFNERLTTPLTGGAAAKMTTMRSPKATVNNQKDWRTDFIDVGAWNAEEITHMY